MVAALVLSSLAAPEAVEVATSKGAPHPASSTGLLRVDQYDYVQNFTRYDLPGTFWGFGNYTFYRHPVLGVPGEVHVDANLSGTVWTRSCSGTLPETRSCEWNTTASAENASDPLKTTTVTSACSTALPGWHWGFKIPLESGPPAAIDRRHEWSFLLALDPAGDAHYEFEGTSGGEHAYNGTKVTTKHV
ncbi:MAG: hypothetical protein Kow0069_14200 [Promethearchaeota archaeon]